jgi:hypothetical protein
MTSILVIDSFSYVFEINGPHGRNEGSFRNSPLIRYVCKSSRVNGSLDAAIVVDRASGIVHLRHAGECCSGL